MTTTPEDTALKARHRAMWALGDYPAVATQVIAELGEVLVDTVGITAGEKVVDIGAGSGNASIPAARRGADVVATDLTPAWRAPLLPASITPGPPPVMIE